MESVEDLESLVNVAIAMSEGKDPSASLLFGAKRMLSCFISLPGVVY